MFALIVICLAALSCKQIKYHELNNFYGGQIANNNDIHLLDKTNCLNSRKNTHIVGSDRIINVKSDTTLKLFDINITNKSISPFRQNSRPTEITHQIKQACKAIPKSNATNLKELKKEYKSLKQIFGYDGENLIMTIGYNILIYSIFIGVGLILLAFLAEATGKNNGLVLFILGLPTLVFGALIGAGIWLLGAFISLFE